MRASNFFLKSLYFTVKYNFMGNYLESSSMVSVPISAKRLKRYGITKLNPPRNVECPICNASTARACKKEVTPRNHKPRLVGPKIQIGPEAYHAARAVLANPNYNFGK